VPGFPASPEAVAAMSSRGLDLSNHLSGPVLEKDLEAADLVVTMTAGHKEALLGRFPAYRSKVRTLSEVSEGAVEGDVKDPFGRDQRAYEETAETIARGLSVLATRLRGLIS